MAPSKEERGSVVRRTLFSQSQQLGDGWLHATVVLELRFTPNVSSEAQRPLRQMGQGYGRGSDRRQAELFPSGEGTSEEGYKGAAKAAQEPQATNNSSQEEREKEWLAWLENASHQKSYGSLPSTGTPSAVPDQPEAAATTKSSTPSRPEPASTQEQPSLALTRLRSTNPHHSAQRNHLQPSRAQATDCEESSVKSGLTSSKRRQRKTQDSTCVRRR